MDKPLSVGVFIRGFGVSRSTKTTPLIAGTKYLPYDVALSRWISAKLSAGVYSSFLYTFLAHSPPPPPR